MNETKKIIAERRIPDALTSKDGVKIKSAKEFEKHREYIKKLLEEHIYGHMPPAPDHFAVELDNENARFCAGKAPLRTLTATVTLGKNKFTFPIRAVIPKSEKKLPCFVSINFSSDVPNKYLPIEEIVDGGFAVFAICYSEITADNKSFRNGIAKYLSPKRRTLSSPGKIAMWAYAAMRVMDYIETLDCIDKDNVAVIGHSRLGKTALLAAAFDNRFKYAISNDSGCAGAAIKRENEGEHIDQITTRFPYWFAKKYRKYATDEYSLPLDQNYLLSLIAPRHLLVGSAEDDLWADPKSEFISTYMASSAWELYGVPGLIHNGEIPKANTVLDKGNISYHIRHGMHYLSREDWQIYMNYIKRQMK